MTQTDASAPLLPPAEAVPSALGPELPHAAVRPRTATTLAASANRRDRCAMNFRLLLRPGTTWCRESVLNNLNKRWAPRGREPVIGAAPSRDRAPIPGHSAPAHDDLVLGLHAGLLDLRYGGLARSPELEIASAIPYGGSRRLTYGM